MGSPRRPRKKYETPEHPWRKERIESEKVLVDDYGLVNKKEIYKMDSRLRSYFRQARSLISSTSLQSKKEEKQLLEKLYKYNLIQDKNTKVENVLNLKLKDVMDRRLQTLVYKNGLAKTIKQARQFIVHGHIFVNGRKVAVPSYLVLRDEENKINYDTVSGLSDPENQERAKILGFMEKKKQIAEAEIKKEPKKDETAGHKEHKKETNKERLWKNKEKKTVRKVIKKETKKEEK
ncbi:MAG: 30S ribosomal protein S4 [Nanoarchaeota archaeon]